MHRLENFWQRAKRTLTVFLTLAILLLGAGGAGRQVQAAEGIVNVGVTYTFNTLNPLLYDATIVNHAAISLQFQPLVELKSDMEFEYLLADEVTTKDNLTFKIHLNDEANWSDGEPITADDVIFTILKTTSKGVGNLNVYNYSNFEGFDEGGQVADDASLEDVPAIQKLDDKTLTLTSQKPIPLNSFLASYLRYIYPLPSHILGDQSSEELRTSTWFNAPDVVSGPYKLVDLNLDHYAAYTANEDYWRGAPQIKSLNLKVVQGSGILAGLQSGELDVVPATMAAIPVEDQAVISGMEGLTASYDKPLTNNYLFINLESVPDVHVRRAILQGVNRQLLLEGFLQGQGEITDGFLNSYSPFFDDQLEAAAFDPEAAKAEMAETEWIQDEPLLFLINSGDPLMTNVANVIVQQLKDLGIEVKVQAMDLGSLLGEVNQHKYDLMAVQYTMVPIDPLADIVWLAASGEEADNWSNYRSAEMNELLDQAALVKDGDTEGMRDLMGQIDRLIQTDVPLVNLYVESPLSVVSDRVSNVSPGSYGMFNDVHTWSLAD